MMKLEKLIQDFKDLGLTKGDVVLLHSSILSFNDSIDPQIIIDAILNVLSTEGTLIVPTYYWDFCKGKSFDIQNTRSKCGVISEIVRNNPDSTRVLHPIYSHSVIGKLKEEIGKMKYKSSFGENSVFSKLRELDGKIMIIGLPFILCNTFAHHVEEMMNVDYRFLKEFKGKIIDDGGNEYFDNFFMNVRPLDGSVETNFDDFEKLMDNEKITRIKKIGKSTIKLMNANQVYARLTQEIKKNPGFLCKFHNV